MTNHAFLEFLNPYYHNNIFRLSSNTLILILVKYKGFQDYSF